MSDYSRQLREKQKARRIYGVLERQFRRYFREAERRPGLAGENLMAVLETRLDNIVYRAGYADSRAQARQLVQHGHFCVNGRRINIPSHICAPQDTISVREESRGKTYFRDLAQRLDGSSVPNWLSLDSQSMVTRVLMIPSGDQIDTRLNDQLIVEFYSR
jgi:small subunit ribosomal protein S4